MGDLIMVGDRVLIAPDEGERKTDSGLVLPASVAEKERVRGGRVVSIGPGYVTPNPEFSEGEPWSQNREAVRYLPLQARPGAFLIVPHSAILALHRHDADHILDNLGSLDDLENEE